MQYCPDINYLSCLKPTLQDNKYLRSFRSKWDTVLRWNVRLHYYILHYAIGIIYQKLSTKTCRGFCVFIALDIYLYLFCSPFPEIIRKLLTFSFTFRMNYLTFNNLILWEKLLRHSEYLCRWLIDLVKKRVYLLLKVLISITY